VSAIKVPSSIMAALSITAVGTILLGVLPGLVLRFGDITDLTGALAR
jgi:NADH-quinone oxidoreductase subunit N